MKRNYFEKNVIRDHDYLYINENRKKKTKENFKFILKNTKKFFREFEQPKILEIGCATGDFLYYINQNFKNLELSGLDILPELLKIAKNDVENASFYKGDIAIKKTLPKKKFDIVYMIAVHNQFDDIKLFMNNFLSFLKPNSYGFIFSFFNPFDYDVIVRTRKTGSNSKWQVGWNVHSIKTFADFLESKGYSYEFIPWNMNKRIPKNKSDGLRSWTVDGKNSKIVTNATRIIHDFYLLKIHKNNLTEK